MITRTLATATVIGTTAVAVYLWQKYRKRAIYLVSLRESFERDGYLLLKGFCSGSECESMMSGMGDLINAWDPSTLSVFRTDGGQQQAQGSDDYFLTSADKVRFFLESGALETPDDPNRAGELRKGVSKERALNKVGHALHVEEPVFRQYSQSRKVKALVRALGWRDPSLVQSMYIFKQPRIGGEVTPHQDSCFLRTEPLSCLGLWLALQRATLENGCLWARPGSHKEPLRRHFVRVGGEENGNKSVHMEFDSLVDAAAPPPAAAWDGKPLAGKAAGEAARLGFVPLPVEQGDLVVIHGQLDHLSMPNSSEKSRHSFQLHLVEGASAGVRWDQRNWLAYPPGKPFPSFSS